MWKDKLPNNIRRTLELYNDCSDTKFLLYVYILYAESFKYLPGVEVSKSATLGTVIQFLNGKVSEDSLIMMKSIRLNRNNYVHDLNEVLLTIDKIVFLEESLQLLDNLYGSVYKELQEYRNKENKLNKSSVFDK